MAKEDGSEEPLPVCGAEPANDDGPFRLGRTCEGVFYPKNTQTGGDGFTFETALPAVRRAGGSVIAGGRNRVHAVVRPPV